MRSDDLVGFSIWYDWNSGSVANAPGRPGVYALRLRGKQFGRLRGESDLVYIGCATEGTVRDRLENHLRSDGSNVAARLRDVLAVGSLEVAWKVVDKAEEASTEEARLLRLYVQQHCELPPVNRAEPARKRREEIRAVEDWLRDKGLPPEQVQELAEKVVAHFAGPKAMIGPES